MAAATPDFERAHFRGRGSLHGFSTTGVEGFARTAPLLAAWIAAGRPQSESLKRILVAGLSTGADPEHPAFWGRAHDRSQLIVESADIALTLWLTRDTVWPSLGPAAQANIVQWLRQAAAAVPHASNWLLFGVVVEAALQALEGRKYTGSPGYDRFKRFYLGHGWFSDHETRRVVDFYNPWGMTYSLFWLHWMQPTFDAEFLRDVVVDSAELTAHLVSPQGIPIMGRSVCYRTALPTPLMLATWLDPTPERMGVARRALDCVWGYFVNNGALRDGTLTQGYFEEDPRILDNYSGPGSCLWGLRSLVPAILHPSGSAFWEVSPLPLPVEQDNFHRECPALGWVIKGEKATGDIQIRIPANAGKSPSLRPYQLSHRLREFRRGRASRPGNHAAAYEAEVYSVLNPFPLRSNK